MATIREIASRLGVSISTVSKGLNDAGNISAEMKQAVLDTALELGYIHKKRKTQNQKVCVLADQVDYESTDSYGYEVLTGFRLEAARHKYEISVIPLALYFKNHQSYNNLMAINHFSGALIMGLSKGQSGLAQLQETTVPTVLLDYFISQPYTASISSNHRLGIFKAIEYLYQLGHKRIAFISGSEDSCVAKEHLDGVYQALEYFKIPIARYLCPPLTTIRQDRLSMGKSAFILLDSLISGIFVNQIRMTPFLIERESAGPCIGKN